MLLYKSGSFRTFCIFEGYFPMFMKNCLLETKFNVYKREDWCGNSSKRIKLFCFKKAYFCIFTKILVVILTQPTCPVHLYCTSNNVRWNRWLGGREVSALDCSALCTLSFCNACGFDTAMWHFFLGFPLLSSFVQVFEMLFVLIALSERFNSI